MLRPIAGAAALAWLAFAPATGEAAMMHTYRADLQDLNGLGVSGMTRLAWNEASGRLDVAVTASGLTPNQRHAQHIHGAFVSGFDGTPADSVTPSLIDDDGDGDGWLELAEGLGDYGAVILPLVDLSTGLFPMASAAGEIRFTESYDLDEAGIFGDVLMGTGKYTKDDLFPLFLREIVLHGGVVPDGAGEGTMGEVDGGANGYVGILPVGAGEIVPTGVHPVPLPAAGWALVAGLGALFGYGRFARRA